jgi:hypothetical protein
VVTHGANYRRTARDVLWEECQSTSHGKVATLQNERHTNDRRYESNDSREMLNGSLSLIRLLCEVVVAVLRDELVWPQKLLRSSPGDGGKQTPESLISVETMMFSYNAMRS